MAEETDNAYHVDRETPDAKTIRQVSKQFVQLCDHGDCESIHYLAAALIGTHQGLELLSINQLFQECHEDNRFHFVGEQLLLAKPRGEFELQKPRMTSDWRAVLNRAGEIADLRGSRVIAGTHGLLAALEVRRAENVRFLSNMGIARVAAVKETERLIFGKAG